MYVQGKGYLDITIGNFSNFLNTENELEQFRVTHHCGVAGTIFEIVFKTRNKSLADLFVQNNSLHISYGETPTKAHEFDVWITEVKQEEDKQGLIKIAFGAVPNVELFTDRTPWNFYGNAAQTLSTYAQDKIAKNTTDGVGMDCYCYRIPNANFKEKWDNYWKIEEPQSWYKNQVTMAQFILELWLHMDLGDDVPLLSFDRYGSHILLNTIKICKSVDIKDIAHFIPAPRDSKEKTDILYIGHFHTKSYKFTTGYATGYDTAIYINKLEGGKDSVFIPNKEVEMATGKKAERRFTGYRAMDNKYQNENTHGKYQECYYHNYYKLVDLSSLVGSLVVKGDVPDTIDLITPVYVDSGDSKTNGRWIVNTIQSTFSQTSEYTTTVFVCRDNYNRIEDSEVAADKNDDHHIINITNQQVSDALQSVRNLRIAVARAQKLLDGTAKAELQSYCQKVKYDFLTMFRVNGRVVDLTTRLGMMHTLIVLGNDIMNGLIDKLFPYPYNMVLHDFLINKPSLLTLLSQLIQNVLPAQYRSLWGDILALLAEVNLIMSTIHQKNSKHVSAQVVRSGDSYSSDSENKNGNSKVLQFKEGIDGEFEFENNSSAITTDEIEGGNMAIDKTEDNIETISNITDEMLDNMDELDIPIPNITLNESESLLTTEDLKEAVAEKVEEHLRNQGYLDGVETAYFISVLLGKKKLDFNTIKLINSNKGNMLYARFWGTYSGELNKLGRVIDITNNVITVSHADLLDEVFEDDTVVVSGIPYSSGSYTVDSIIRRHIETENEDYYNTLITTKENIQEYTDTPIRTYTTLCKVSKVTFGHTLEVYDAETDTMVPVTNLTAIHIPGRVVRGQVEKFLAPTLPISITNLGQDGYCSVYRSEYDSKNKETIVYTRTIFSYDTIENDNMVLQVVVESDSAASISKLSNHTFTEFYIKNSFKDIYATVPCTKIVSALRNSKVWVALPQTEGNVLFYLNNQLAEMDILSGVNLGLYNAGGAPLYYNVFMSKDTFNSNNVILEIRKES